MIRVPTKEATMHKRASALFAMSLLITTVGFAKNKKPILPPYVLSAHTVVVIIDPTAGISVEDPQANRVAQKDVEAALLNWGRFEPLLSKERADLIIVVRKGSGRLVDETISDPRQNNRPGTITPTDNGVSIGAQHGTPSNQSSAPGLGPTQETPHTQMEVGNQEDYFTVYEGDVEDPLNAAPAWRYIAKDGLRPHNVPAVDEFRKALAEAEKAAAAAAAKHP
jgi:hypothetical protein